MNIILLGIVFLISRYRKSTTLDQFVGHVVLYSKLVVIACLFLLDKRIMCWYMVLIGVVFVTCKQPKYNGPHRYEILSHVGVTNRIERGNPKVTFILELGTTWSDECTNLAPTFAELSLRYATNALVFCKADVGKWPELASKFNIDTGATSSQLPTYILFERGKEARRLPPLNGKGEVVKTSINKEGLIAYFDLDRRMIESWSKNGDSQ